MKLAGICSTYLQHAAYVCQPGRAFREGLTHMAFYAHGAIQREVPRIIYRQDDVAFTAAEATRRAGSDGMTAVSPT